MQLVPLRFGQEPYRIAGRSHRVEVRATVSFYDEASGGFHGATCSSVPEAGGVCALQLNAELHAVDPLTNAVISLVTKCALSI
jgi:hypothetical protein